MNKHEKEKFNLNNLPVDIWVEIVYFLDCPSIFNFSITCKDNSAVVKKSFNELNFSASQLKIFIQRLDKLLYLMKEELLRHDYQQLNNNINDLYQAFKNDGLNKTKISSMLNSNLNCHLDFDLSCKRSRPIFLDPLFFGTALAVFSYSIYKHKQILLILSFLSAIAYRHHFQLKDEKEIKQLLAVPTSLALLSEEKYIEKHIKNIETDATIKITAFRKRFFAKYHQRFPNETDDSGYEVRYQNAK